MKLKNKILIGLTAGAAILAAGCSTPFATQVFNGENVVSQGAAGATHTFNTYFNMQTNPSPSLVSARDDLYAADVNLGLALTITENLREEYETNSTATNQAAVSLALSTAQLQLTNIVNLVQSVIAATK